MTESMIVEAIRAAGAGGVQNAAMAAGGPQAAADPSAVARFQAAMATGGVQPADSPDPVPFASEVATSWRSAQVNNQGILHRIRALTELKESGNVAAMELLELQYEVANLAFQQEVVTKVADKTSNAIQTLVKNQ